MKYRLVHKGMSVAATTLLLLSGQLYANSIPVLEVQDQVVHIGSKLSFLVAPADVDGVTASVFIRSGPDGGKLSDNGDGTKTFSWHPTKKGDYTVNFIVQDGANASLANQYAYNIRVIGTALDNVAANVAIKAIGTPVNIIDNATVELLGTNTDGATVSAIVEPAANAALEPIILEPIISVAPVPATSAALELADSTTEETPDRDTLNSVASSSDQSIVLQGRVGSVTKILANLPVSKSQTNVQQTSIDSSGRYLYTANIEPGPNGDSEGVPLRTVLRQGFQRSDNSWEWKSVIVEDRTLHNRWHTAPSVAVDRSGQIHVAYNMHNFPWQYKKSDRAHDISSMVFKGQPITDDELKMAAEQNRTSFPTLGSAEIPGNQITYPAFYKDKNNDLYVSYRFAGAPARAFADRIMSTGIAKYDTGSQAWSAIGAKLDASDGDFSRDAESPNSAVAFAAKKGWTSYLPRVVFSKQNNMIVSMLWRNGVAGRQVTMPCVARSITSSDVVDMKGGSMSLPIQPEQCGNIGIGDSREFFSIGSFAIDNEDNPYLLLSPTSGDRFIARYSPTQQRWIQEKAPEAATEIFFDNDNNMYAIATGIKIFKRTSTDANWETIYSENTGKNCYPKVKMDAGGKNAFIHAQSCDEKHITIYGLRLP